MMNKFGNQLGEFLEFNHITAKEFAERINTTPKNLNDIIKGKIELSQNMIFNISFVTSIPVSYIENVEFNFKMDKLIQDFLDKNNITIKEFINRFSYKEFSKSYNCPLKDERDEFAIAKDILKYLRITNPASIYKEDSPIFYKSKNDKPELLLLWLERCYKIALTQDVGEYNKENINNLVSFISKEAEKNFFNPQLLIKSFNENGIYLVIENDLKGSKIRGAFKMLNDKPAIFITKKHKRIADIYFALLHELAHCKSDFNRAKSGSLISVFDQNELDDYEKKADAQAYNWMINDKDYDIVKKNMATILDNSFVKSFLVYRLAKDRVISYSSKLYQENNPLINEL